MRRRPATSRGYGSAMSEHPPGTHPPPRFRPRLHWELVWCGLHGHALEGTDAADVKPEHALFVREDSTGTRWHRCLRCDSWLALPAPARPSRATPPARDEIKLPLRGKPLRDLIVLRLIAIDRAFHFVVLAGLGVLVFLFSADRATFRHDFFKVVADLQGGTVAGSAHARRGFLHTLDNLFTTSSSHLHALGAVLLVYAVVEGVEAVGLWYAKRWAEYLTFLVTASLLPFEVYEIAHRASPLKIVALVINIAVVVYLLHAKRLFGIRGGVAAERAEAARDQGWPALERTAPPTPVS
jgi:uncharacterized membrane protein (DUF2068 family)